MFCTFHMSCAAGAIRRILLTAVMLSAVALAPTVRAQLHAGASAVSELEAVLELVSFDRGSRTAVLQGAEGIDLRVTVPPEVQMFEHVKPGELFSMRYTGLHTHELNKGGVAGVSQAQAAEFASTGSAPAGRLINAKRITLLVEEVDQANRTVAVRDANDKVVTLAVDEDEQGFDQITAGDTITITSIETVELGVLSPEHPAQPMRPIEEGPQGRIGNIGISVDRMRPSNAASASTSYSQRTSKEARSCFVGTW